jgi:hypothetical protein
MEVRLSLPALHQWPLQRFPFIWDHRMIPYERKTPWIPLLANVLVGEPDSTSPGHALGTRQVASAAIGDATHSHRHRSGREQKDQPVIRWLFFVPTEFND